MVAWGVAGTAPRRYHSGMNCRPYPLLIVVGLYASWGVACGRMPQAETAATPRVPAADTTAVMMDEGSSESAVAGQLAVALDGDVTHLGDTRYQAVGPELRCSAMLLPDDGGPPVPATSLVEWKVLPESGGSFSIGAQGAYFLPASTGVVIIHAELPGAAGARRSPGLSLSVSSSGPSPGA